MIALFSMQSFAADTIKITVKTNESSAAAIGYTIAGKESGGPEKSYAGTGQKNKTYSFGYRKNSIKGKNIPCGSLTLTKDSKVTLVMKGNQCHSIVN